MKKTTILSSLLWAGAAGFAGATEGQPNIVIIVSDDHRTECLGYFQHPDVKTPNLDRLAEGGAVFRHAYVQAAHTGAVCLPSRTQMHSGRSIYNWGARREPESTADGYSLGRAFRAAGYATLRSGKGVNVPSPLNAEYARNFEDSTIPLETHLENAASFIRENAGKRPFFLVLEPRVPHSPYPSTEQFAAMYPPEKITLPPEFMSAHPFLDPIPGHKPGGREKGQGIPMDGQGWTEQLARATLARYYASISFLDDGVGRIVGLLRENGVADSTYVFFVGDNGFSISHHGLFGKSDLYENGGLHVPMIVAGPGIAHRESGAFVYMSDIFPTACELAGLPVPAKLDGRSFAPLLRGAAVGGREVAFTAFRDEQFALRDGRWKLIRFPKLDRVEFFDLQTDPREMKNLSGATEHAARIAEMTARIEIEKTAAGYAWPLP